jgi:hypothetical protein
MRLGEKLRRRHTPEEDREIREAALDRTIENSFPASDPPSSIPNPADQDAFDRIVAGDDAQQSLQHLSTREATS